MTTSLLSNVTGSAATASAATGTAATPVASAADQGLQLFTQLLVAQVKNQDPTSPTDPTQFVNQLTQQTEMEALQKIADQGGTNASSLQGLQVLALGAQVGSQVTVAADRVRLGDQPVPLSFTLGSATSKTDLVLTGVDGVEHHVALGTRPAGDVSTTLDPAALGLAPGSYSMRVDTDTHEQPTVQVSGAIANVRVSPTGGIVVGVANVGDIDPSQITEFNGHPGN
jgi:flagellar basal-body rod modification protein FlgD